MRLAFVSFCGYPWGGSELLWSEVALSSLERGDDVLVSVFDWPNQHEKINLIASKGAKMVYRRRFFPNIKMRLYKKVINYLRPINSKYTYHQYLNDFNPDHIFFSLASGDEIINDDKDLMIFVNQCKVPFSVFYHSYSLNSILSVQQKKNYCILFNRSSANYFTSRHHINTLQKQLNFNISNAHLMFHPLRNIKNISLLEDEVKFVRMCIIGSLVTRWKGQDIVLNILSSPKWINRNWQLNIYGDGHDLNILQDLVIKFKLRDKVIFHGYIGDVSTMLNNSHLILIPSRQDSGPIVLFESMLAGRPIVGTPIGAMCDFIITDFNGVLAKDIEEKSFEDALEYAWKNIKSWPSWGLNSRSIIKAKYDFDFVDKLLVSCTKSIN